MTDTKELRRLLEAATSGPWVAQDDASHIPGGFEPNRVVDSSGYSLADVTGDSDDLEWANTLLIVAAVNSLEELLDDRDRVIRERNAAQAENERLRVALEWYRSAPWGHDGEDRPYIDHGGHREHPDFREKDGGNIARAAIDKARGPAIGDDPGDDPLIRQAVEAMDSKRLAALDENARLREALQHYAEETAWAYAHSGPGAKLVRFMPSSRPGGHGYDIARAALDKSGVHYDDSV